MYPITSKILGLMEIKENGTCSKYIEFENGKKKFDGQIIAGFFYALNSFLKDFTDQEPLEIKTIDYKIVFEPNNKKFNVYFLEREFEDEFRDYEL
jgi:hypothetical protein